MGAAGGDRRETDIFVDPYGCHPRRELTCQSAAVCAVLIRNMTGGGSRPGEMPIDTATPSVGALT
jgi:hypothetical protein